MARIAGNRFCRGPSLETGKPGLKSASIRCSSHSGDGAVPAWRMGRSRSAPIDGERRSQAASERRASKLHNGSPPPIRSPNACIKATRRSIAPASPASTKKPPSRLQATQAQRLRVHDFEELKTPANGASPSHSGCRSGRQTAGASFTDGKPREGILYAEPQRWRRRRTSLASLTRAARYVDPPWSGCNFFMSERWARADVLRVRPGLNAKDLISFLFSHFAAARRAAARSPLPHCLARAHANRAPGDQDTLQVDRGCRRRPRRAEPISVAGSSASSAAPGAAGENAAAHGAAVVIELHFEIGGAHARSLARLFCVRPAQARRPQRNPAQHAKPDGADRKRDPDLAPHQQKSGEQQHSAAAQVATAARPAWDRPWKSH